MFTFSKRALVSFFSCEVKSKSIQVTVPLKVHLLQKQVLTVCHLSHHPPEVLQLLFYSCPGCKPEVGTDWIPAPCDFFFFPFPSAFAGTGTLKVSASPTSASLCAPKAQRCKFSVSHSRWAVIRGRKLGDE